MPELPDVEVFRRYLEATSLHQEIKGLEVDDGRVIRGSLAELERSLRGKKLSAARRHGKHLFAAADGGWLELHFGMTGSLDYHRDAADDPPYSHAVIRFANGFRLAFVDRRKLGHLGWVPDLEAYLEEEDLGPDALSLDREGFRRLAEGRRGQVKCWLMDQSALAGLGNVYSDEVLFQAGIPPRRPVAELSGQDLDALFDALHRVADSAIEAGVDPGRMPDDFLVPRRQPGAACPRCGTPLEDRKVCGRTSYRCPRCQPG